ncbi:MAG: hypothetical protein ABSF61_14695 [Anaerolineales bacterium]|jgi:hypothetical protein
MFIIFKRDPAQEKLKIPNELFGVTPTAAGNACNILNGAGLKGKFSREAIFAEVCGYHVKTVILEISRVETPYLDVEEGFNQGARFLLENGPRVLSRLRDPKVSQGLRSHGCFAEDLGYIERFLFADKTFSLAASYCSGLGLGVDNRDVRALGRYFAKLLGHTFEQLGSQFAYSARCWRLSHLEYIPHEEFRSRYVVQFSETLIRAIIELEANVDKRLPEG